MATYHYTASAVGLGGVLKDRTGVTIVRSLASVALAPTGGEGFSEIADYDSDGISFSKARSHVTGYDSAGRTFTTTSDICITNLNLFGRVKAASLQTSISSTREVLASDSPKTEHPDKARFSISSMIVGLTIDGVEVNPELDLDLCRCATYADVCKEYAKRRLAVPPANAQLIRASFVKDLHYAPTTTVGPQQDGFKVPVENLGTVHIGEMILKPGTRTVNLLRIDFDEALRLPQRARASTRRQQSAQTANADAAEVTTTAAEATSLAPQSGTMTILSLHGNGVPSWP